MLKRLTLPLLLLAAPALGDVPAPLPPPPTVAELVDVALSQAPKGARFGLLVVDESGSVVFALNPDQRFIPASNTKMFTTAAAWALLPEFDKPDQAGGTSVALRAYGGKRPPDVVLLGAGDARMSGASDCKIDCLATLADAVAAKTRRVGDVVGDDTAFPDERWSPGMSWNNIQNDDGTAAGALNLDDNQLKVTAQPGRIGQQPVITVSPYFTVINQAFTGAAGHKPTLAVERVVGSKELRIYGELPVDVTDWKTWIGIDDPAHYAAWSLREMLAARGVKVTGKVRVSHRPIDPLVDQSCDACGVGTASSERPEPFAALTPASLAEDVLIINKVSQNMHAQVLFHRLGAMQGTGSTDWAVKAEHDLYEKAGIPREGYDFSDGSGMSTYNRVSPRAAVALLRWIDKQPWGSAWYATLPIAGVDGTLKRRFVGTPLAGNLSAKTGTLNATNALSGTFRAASGRRLTFAFFANDVPNDASALAAMEAALLAIAAHN